MYLQDFKFGKHNSNNLQFGMPAKLVKFNQSIKITHPEVFETTFTSTQKSFNLCSKYYYRNGRYRIRSANQIY